MKLNGQSSGTSPALFKRVIVCLRCHENGLSCDNDFKCAHCVSEGVGCIRAKCFNYKAGDCKREGCSRWHEDDDIDTVLAVGNRGQRGGKGGKGGNGRK